LPERPSARFPDAPAALRAHAVGVRSRCIVLIVLAGLVVAGCGGHGAPHRAAAPRTPVVVDTDMSTDDVLALLYLLGRRDVDVLAVAVSGTGLADCPAGARNARALLAVAGRPDLPVGCGGADPLVGANAFPPDWRERADELFGLDLPPAQRAASRSALDVLRAGLESSDYRATVLVLGPMTDLAQLLRAHPAVRSRIGAIVAMGGAVGVPGNVGAGHERSEWNLWIDPVAAREVLRSGLPTTLVGLDATNDVPATVYPWLALRRYHYAGAPATVAWDLMTASGMYTGGQYFWDPLAATAIARPDVLDFAHKRIDVVTAGTDAGRAIESAGGVPVRVAVGADRPAFERQFVQALVRGAPFAIPETVPRAVVRCRDSGCSYSGPRRTEPGQGGFETVNDGARSFTYVLGRLSEGRAVADLRRHVRALGGRAWRPPVWFSTQSRGETPPHSTMTWMVTMATPGDLALVVTTPVRTEVVTGVAVR
jgi:pyrimidine-specific ribonucleoside hydrolase